MPNPKQATTSRSGQRYYTWRDEKFWSVTTIIGGGVPKPALINWAKKFTAEYAVNHIDALRTLVDDDPAGAIDWLKGAAYRDRDKKADLGTAVHEAVEAYVLGKPFPKWAPDVKARMLNFEVFLSDFEPEFHAAEASVYSRTYRYAGTLDGLCTIGGRRYVLDLKTGGKAIYPEVALQLAAYRYADFMEGADGSEVPMPEVDAAAALHLPEAGYELVDVDADEDVHRYFLHIKESFRWQEEKSKQVLRGPLRIADDGVADLGQMLLGEGKA